jgi:3-hydroxyacyl-CoA dehydrogenase / enoyl-CoA hydratase / 3-hydroxybutyryl-CoA epimerase
VEILPLDGRISATALSLETRTDGVVLLTLHPEVDRPNLLTTALLTALDERIAEIERAVAAGRADALVVRSARPGTFLSGVDLDEILELRTEAEAIQQSRLGQRVLRRLERLEIPTVAAIDGTCVGAGLELALACGYRIASGAPHTQLGLFHIRVGIAPSYGGTVRLPRLIGVQAALDLILSGDSLSAMEARSLGLVDEVVPADGLDARVVDFARQRVERGRKRGARRRMRLRLLEDTAPGRRLIFRRAAKRLGTPGGEPSPAARRALEMLAESVNLPLDRAFEREAELAGSLLVSESARALVHAFRVGRSTRRLQAAAEAPEQAAVLGAGDVGVELAFGLISAGLSVRLRDRRRETLGLGIRRALSRIAEVRLADRISEDEADRRGARLSAGRGFGGFGTLDLVLAAEGEGDAWVRAALQEAADHTREACVLAYASPLLSSTQVQREISRPDRVIGFHPVLPGGAFPLVEISPGENTAPEVTAICVALARRMGRAAVVVPAGTATPVIRLLGAYFTEALALLEEGAGILQVDRAAESFGFAMGPLRRIDAIGTQRVGRYLQHLAEHYGATSLSPSPLLERVSQNGGFYKRGDADALLPNPVLPPGLPEAAASDLEPIRRRLVLRLINEAALLLQDAAIAPVDLELLSLTALGFPRLRGGILHHADHIGTGAIVGELRECAERFGPRFRPAPLLDRLAGGSGDLRMSSAASGQSLRGVL